MGWNPSLKADKSSSQNLSAGALLYTTAIGRRFKLESVSVHASVNITETITVTLISALGSNYNVILAKRDMISEKDFVFRPSGELNLQANDEIRVECTNANLTGTVYPVVKTSEILN